MITPSDLFELAAFDLPRIKSEAAARRAISTAYYAAFHAIAWAGANLFNGPEQVRQRIARSYDHAAVGKMAAEMASRAKLPGADPGLAVIARNFPQLYRMRQTADYDLSADVTWKDGADSILQALDLMRHLDTLKAQPAFAELLLLPLLRDAARRG